MTRRSLSKIHRPSVFNNNLHSLILGKLAHRRTDPFSVRQLSNTAVPRGREAGLGIEKAYRELQARHRLVYGKAQVIWIVVLNRLSKGL